MTPAQVPQDDQHDPRQPEPSPLRRLARHTRHVYRTRVRTTTVVLVLVFIALTVFYAFSSQHYYPDVHKQPAQQVQQTRQPTTDETIPTTSESPSTSAEPTTTTPTGTESSPSGKTTPTETPLFPNPFQPRPPTAETTVEPTTTPTGGNRP